MLTQHCFQKKVAFFTDFLRIRLNMYKRNTYYRNL